MAPFFYFFIFFYNEFMPGLATGTKVASKANNETKCLEVRQEVLYFSILTNLTLQN